MKRSPAFLFLLTIVLANVSFAGTIAVADGAQAAAPRAANVLGRNEELVLVIHTAEDCPVCKVWRESPSGLPVASELPRRWPHLRVVFIERKSLYGSESESLYPADLRFMYQARRERYQLSPAVPLFEIVRGEELIARQAGLQAWSDGILPSLQQLEADRSGSVPQSDPSSRKQ